MMATLPEPEWRKSSFSGAPQQNCLEIATAADGHIMIRNSTNPDGPVLLFSPAEWTAFLDGVSSGEFNS
jgi:hypothetical protein